MVLKEYNDELKKQNLILVRELELRDANLKKPVMPCKKCGQERIWHPEHVLSILGIIAIIFIFVRVLVLFLLGK